MTNSTTTDNHPLDELDDITLLELAYYLRHNDLYNVKAWLQQYDDFMGVYTVPCKEGNAKVFLKSRIAAHYSYEV